MPCVAEPEKFKEVEGFSVTAGAGGGAATEVPDSGMDCGLPAALSVMTSVAWLVPTPPGA